MRPPVNQRRKIRRLHKGGIWLLTDRVKSFIQSPADTGAVEASVVRKSADFCEVKRFNGIHRGSSPARSVKEDGRKGTACIARSKNQRLYCKRGERCFQAAFLWPEEPE